MRYLMSTGTNKYDNGQTYFSKIILDFDTALFKAARSVEEDYVIVKNKKTGVEKEYRTQTEFFGRSEKVLGGVLGDWCEFVGWNLTRGDFEITKHSRIKSDFEDDPVEYAMREFNLHVGRVKNSNVAEDYLIVIGGFEKNFRYDVAKIQPYKGARKEKPIVFADLKDKVIAQYKNKIQLAEGCEADDVLGWYATENQETFRKTGEYPYVLGYIDKDLKQLWGPSVNLDKITSGITYISPKESTEYFCIQLLKGDKATDNILGVGEISQETREMYGIRKGNGVGDVAANAILEGSKNGREMFVRVVDTYKKAYPEPITLESGDIYTWKDFLRENALLLWMQRKEGQRFDIIEFLEKEAKIDLEKVDLIAEEINGKKQIKQKEETSND